MNSHVADFIASVDAVRSFEELWEATGEYLDGLGFTHSIYTYVRTANSGESRVWTSLPRPWQQRYLDQGFQRVDPFYRYCCSTFAEIRTGPSYLGDHAFLTAQERRVVLEGGETGFRSGFSAPVRLVGSGEHGGWNFGTRLGRREFEALFAEHGRDLRLAGFVIHEHAERLSRGSDLPVARLTLRERECLLWLSRGLRTAAIAEKLDIAEVTVDLHFKGARRKLKAATREQALAKALLHGLLHP